MVLAVRTPTCVACGAPLEKPKPGDNESMRENLTKRCRACVLGVVQTTWRPR